MTISAISEQAIKELLTDWWAAVTRQLAAATGAAVQLGNAPVDTLLASEVGLRLVRIAQAAEGQIKHTDASSASILQDCDAFEAWLNEAPIAHKTPEEFWQTPVGYMVLQARLWAENDRLITLSDAASLSGLSLSNLSQRITRGQVMGFTDPREANPRRARRIRESDARTLAIESGKRQAFAKGPFTKGNLPNYERVFPER